MLAILLVAVLSTVPAGCTGGSDFLVPSNSANQPDFESVYRIGPGDTVRITVFGEEDLSGEYKVDGNQTITLPLAGEVRIGGLTLRMAEEKAVEALQDGFLVDPRVSMDVISYRPFYILGEVGAPGSYPWLEGMSILNAVAIAGGFTYRAENGQVEILRPQQGSPEVIVSEVHANVLPGDIIYIRERIF